MSGKIFTTLIADYSDKRHAEDIITLLDHYARDIAGGGNALDERVKANLTDELAVLPNAFSVLAYQRNKAVGLMNCFMGFSTFKCQPLVNIHDIVVIEPLRRRGVCSQMLRKVEEIARDRDCCKLTLEVLQGNRPAYNAYEKFGFTPYELDSSQGTAQFLEKSLSD